LCELPKLQKENNIPLLPVVFLTDSLNYGLAKELTSLLKPLVGKSKHHVRNFSDLAWSVAKELLQTDEVGLMVSFDVVLYLYSQKFQFNWH